ncbi:collagen binding domain-containing protein [Paenibacillus sp. G2S3]|uniref:collagen binding domain-containing protein n=1 Tax=Paenibacillus sp. G2S3 TaxID=3047872 RepID=UPI0024C12B25|nr:collagen binding domain-containing protein [Paenibacillus sp. G2S3]WHY17903.1 collagen binding domain-containing protein [Paenibacillus sp. G2S3]
MLKKRISVMLVILMLVAQYAYGIGFAPQVKAAAIDQERNIITIVSMAVYGADGQTVTDSVYEQDANVTLDYTWSLPKAHPYKQGDTFTFQLPEQFQLFNDINGSLVSEDGDVGTFTVEQLSHQVTMSFNDYIETHDDVQGTLRINTKFDKQKISGSTVQQILFPVSGGVQTVTVNFKPSVGSTIEKRGIPQGFNADYILWSVDVNKSLKTVGNAVVTDPIPTGLSLSTPVTVSVYQLSIQLDGSVTQGALLDTSKYSSEFTEGSLNVRFTDPAISSAYRIEYSTAITDEHQLSFTNTATFTGDGQVPASSSATVQVERGGSLNKYSSGYDWSNQIISWAIEYNYNKKTIPQGNAVLKDLFNDSQALVADSIKVYTVQLDSAGTATLGNLLTKDLDYTVVAASDVSKSGFTLQFKQDITSPYRIEYKTKAVKRVFEDTTITNTVTDSTYTEQATRLIRSAILYKNLTDVDYQNKTVGWKVTLNSDNYPMGQVEITESFPFGGLKFIPESLVIRNSNGSILKPADYILVYNTPVQSNKGFKVVFKSAISETYTISYRTDFNKDWIWSNTENFNNKVRMDWIDTSEVPRTTEAEGLFIPRVEAKSNGLKFGSYNASTKELAWTLGVNYNSKTIAEPEVVDILKSGQTLVPESLKVYTMNVAKNGDPTKGVEVNSSKYTYSVNGNNELKVSFTDAIQSAYYIEFHTSLEGKVIGTAIDNKANLYDGTKKVSKDLNASVKIPYGDEYLLKNGVQNGEKIDWSIQINRSQSTVMNALIKDTPSANQILLQDSFHLYPTTLAENGDVTKNGPELTQGIDYSLEIKTDVDGKQSFDLSFAKEISKPYILDYQSLIMANTGDKVINTVRFSGFNVIEISKDSSKEIIVGVSSGSGSGSGVRGSLMIKKLDAEDNLKTLGDATFALYRLNGSDRVFINSLTTDSAGTATFNKLWLGNYVLMETTAPSGYVLDPTEHPVSIHSSSTNQLVITNQKAVEPTPTATPEPTIAPTATPSASSEPTVTPSTEPTVAPTSTPTSGTPGGPVTPTPTSSLVPGVIINDPAVPTGPGNTTGQESATSEEEGTPDLVITDENVPLGEVDIVDEEVPKGTVNNNTSSAPQLPKTGESSPAPLYMTGIGLIAIGFTLNRVFRRKGNLK